MTSTDVPVAATESRISCATAMRELGHSMVGHTVPDDVLDRIRSRRTP